MAELKDIGLRGLTSAEAEGRLAADGPNELPTAKPRNLLQQAWDVVREPMLLLLLGAGTVNFVLSAPRCAPSRPSGRRSSAKSTASCG